MSRLGLLLLFLATNALAETWLTVPIASYHLDRKGYNEFNYGIGVEYALTQDLRAGLGTFNNSLGRDSWYFGGTYTPLEVLGVKVGTSFGVVTGYVRNSNKGLPMFAPTLVFERQGYGINVVVIPPVQHGKAKTSGVLGLQLKLRLD